MVAVAMMQEVQQKRVRRIPTVWSDIETFLKDCGLKSKNTAITYRTAIRDFFQYTCSKSLEQLTIEDIRCDYRDVLDYRAYLFEEKGMAVGTVNLKLAAVKQVMVFLARHDEYEFINVQAFTLKKLDGKADSYGELSFDEAMTFVQTVKNQEKGEEKSLLFEMATFTSIRRDALLSLEWKNFEVRENEKMVIVTTVDKGQKEDRKPIDVDLYNRLLAIKRPGESKVFSLTRKTANRAVRTVCDELSIADERNIVLHSFKKVAINWILRNEGDVIKATRQGNHSDMNTMWKYYARMKEDFSTMAGMNMGKEIDTSILSGMNAEQLLMVIAQASHGTKIELAKLAMKVLC